jgi:hypothetical protein
MRSRFAFSAAALILAALIPTSQASAQRDGGGGGGFGGGRNPGGLDMAIAPRFVDLKGPFAFDSVQALLALETAQKAKLDQIRTDHLAKTQALRDSAGSLAVTAGYTSPVPGVTPVAGLAKDKAQKDYAKVIAKLHKVDSDFYLKTVKPVMNAGQWTSYKSWVQEKSVQRGRGGMGGMGGGMGGMRGGGDYSGN